VIRPCYKSFSSLAHLKHLKSMENQPIRKVKPKPVYIPRDHDQYKETYEKDGFVIIPKVVDHKLIRELRNHISFLMTKYPDIPPEHFHHHIMRNDPFWVRVVSDFAIIKDSRNVYWSKYRSLFIPLFL